MIDLPLLIGALRSLQESENIESALSREEERLSTALLQARHVFVVTGAGMSADSGLPTYRGVGGLYEEQDTEDGMPIEVALSGTVFRDRPEITWKYLSQVERATRGAVFNRGHQVLAEMEKHFEQFAILTQNIDGFHFAAGSKNVIEIHGNLHHLHCTQCEHRITVEDFSGLQIPPVCRCCDGMMRPTVVLFEEALPQQALATLDHQMRQPLDVVISIGTSSHFPYIVQPVVYAKQIGACTAEINPAKTTLSEIVDIKILQPAATVLDRVWHRVCSLR